MAVKKVIVCDGCEKAEPLTSYREPSGWCVITVEKDGSALSKVEKHACSPLCAGKLLREMASNMDPRIEVPASGHPFR
jgi:hypothetical protein